MAICFNPPGLWGRQGGSFSQGVVQPEGRVVYCTGQVAWGEDNKVVGKGDVAAQARHCLARVEIVLGAVGGRLDDIVSMTIFYTDPAQIPVIGTVRQELFDPERAPVSIFIQVAGLVHPELMVEFVPIAVVPHARYREPA
ncbi:MAG: RidA family protein [Kiloniellales bacterium]|nr:RidA family protein [Kiloniellales bacterium]